MFNTDKFFHSAFKYCCKARGEKLEKTKITYACLARVVRDGGFKIAVIVRMSAIPGHCQFVMKCSAHSSKILFCPPVTTAIFSTCGMNIFVFVLAALLSMPKQFVTVYLGVILRESSTGKDNSHCNGWSLI